MSVSLASENNPLGELINLIPWEATVLDIPLLDSMRSLLMQYAPYTNSNILELLFILQEHRYLVIVQSALADCKGSIYILQRINNGN